MGEGRGDGMVVGTGDGISVGTPVGKTEGALVVGCAVGAKDDVGAGVGGYLRPVSFEGRRAAPPRGADWILRRHRGASTEYPRSSRGVAATPSAACPRGEKYEGNGDGGSESDGPAVGCGLGDDDGTRVGDGIGAAVVGDIVGWGVVGEAVVGSYDGRGEFDGTGLGAIEQPQAARQAS